MEFPMSRTGTDEQAVRRRLHLLKEAARRPLTGEENDEQARHFAEWQESVRSSLATEYQETRERHRIAVHNQIVAEMLWKAVNQQYASAVDALPSSPGSFETFEGLESSATDLFAVAQGCEAIARSQRQEAHRRTLHPLLQDHTAFEEAGPLPSLRLAWLVHQSFFRKLTDVERRERDDLLEENRRGELAAAEASNTLARRLAIVAARAEATAEVWAERLDPGAVQRPNGKQRWVAAAVQAAEEISANLDAIGKATFAAVCPLSDTGR
jgi:hypothetical protein